MGITVEFAEVTPILSMLGSQIHADHHFRIVASHANRAMDKEAKKRTTLPAISMGKWGITMNNNKNNYE